MAAWITKWGSACGKRPVDGVNGVGRVGVHLAAGRRDGGLVEVPRRPVDGDRGSTRIRAGDRGRPVDRNSAWPVDQDGR